VVAETLKRSRPGRAKVDAAQGDGWLVLELLRAVQQGRPE
jgi:hypothetical protein